MEKSKIFIASSGRALTLARVLEEQLDATGFCAAKLWTNASWGQPSLTIIEMLDKASETYDFAVIVLAKDDLMLKDAGEALRARDAQDVAKLKDISGALKARDNCVFEAGLFMGALGREHCFLVNSVERSDLPSDLEGVIYLKFEERASDNLNDAEHCRKQLEPVVARIQDDIRTARARGTSAKNKRRIRLLAWNDLLEREKLDRSKGGELEEGQVVVTAIQPVETLYTPALQVRKNIDNGVSYIYFFHGDDRGANNICRLLQMVLLAPLFEPLFEDDDKEAEAKANEEAEARANDFPTRLKMLGDANNVTRVLTDLTSICRAQTIKIVATSEPPILEYCIHNAGNNGTAVAYMKYGDKFLEWARGSRAYDFWAEVKERYEVNRRAGPFMFYETKKFRQKQQQRQAYYRSIAQNLAKYFPDIDGKVSEICGVQDTARKRRSGSVKQKKRRAR